MNTATQPPPVTEVAERFRCAADIPDPPPDAAGRKQYWEDTVAEAVAELRRRLASGYDEKSFQALQMILDLEKTRIRHNEPVAGTRIETRWSSGLGSMEDSTSSGGKYEGSKKSERKEDLAPPAAPATRDREASWKGEAPAAPQTTPEARQEPRPPDNLPMPLPGGRGSQEHAVPLGIPSPERGGGRGVGASSPTPAEQEEEVGPDGMTADQRAWIQQLRDHYDRRAAARAAAGDVRLLC